PVATPPPTPTTPPRRRARLPEDEATRLTDATFRSLMFYERRQPSEEDAAKHLFAAADHLAEAYPDDGRAVFAAALARLLRSGEGELAVRRDLVRAFTLDPPAADALRDRAARLSFALGFERAAADLLEPLLAGARTPETRACVDLTTVLGKAEAPVQDAARALTLARLAAEAADVERDVPRGRRSRDQPRGWETRVLLAHLLAFHGDKAGAAQALREAADRTRWEDQHEQLRAEADRLDALPSLGRPQGSPLRRAPYAFPLGRFLGWWGQLAERSDAIGEDDLVAEALEERARVERAADPGRAAVLLVAAARAHERAGAPDAVVRCLETAAELDLSVVAADVTALVRRRSPGPARPPAGEAAAARRAEGWRARGGGRGRAPRLHRGRAADAWVLVGQARRALGDGAGAAEGPPRARPRRARSTRGGWTPCAADPLCVRRLRPRMPGGAARARARSMPIRRRPRARRPASSSAASPRVLLRSSADVCSGAAADDAGRGGGARGLEVSLHRRPWRSAAAARPRRPRLTCRCDRALMCARGCRRSLRGSWRDARATGGMQPRARRGRGGRGEGGARAGRIDRLIPGGPPEQAGGPRLRTDASDRVRLDCGTAAGGRSLRRRATPSAARAPPRPVVRSTTSQPSTQVERA
ncbi:MAG: hypothetical protein KF878_37735, partial [Planctomycetes bacterium]|nr:hypothetical protein [Planctomycetota bacterium]